VSTADGGSDGLGALLHGHRVVAGLSQEELSDRSGLSARAISNIERGKTPHPYARSVRLLADALGLPGRAREELLRAACPARDGPPGAGAAGLGLQPVIVPRQLPAAVGAFVGRKAELAALTQILDQAPRAPGTVVISAIGGTPGVGKTALALHWAHQVADRFGDRQLYVNLRGFEPSGTPAAPAEAIRGFLDALSVPPEQIPVSPEAQAGLYRSLLAGKQMLLVLDNARDEQQVRPLLPASPGSLVLVTSRSQLGGLAAADGARLLTLDVLTHAEAVQLLAARFGAARAAAEPGATGRIARLCACLPLALAVAAAQAAARPRLPLAALAGELADSAGRLDALDAGDPGSSVRAVFSWSVRQLTNQAARTFRLLGIHPGPDITVPAAASHFASSLALYQRLGNRLGEAKIHQNLGVLAEHQAATPTRSGTPSRHCACSRPPATRPPRPKRSTTSAGITGFWVTTIRPACPAAGHST
jgi:transcriptional regulator with XRE-family HTH domain